MSKCDICGEPMPPGEEMFKFHGYSGPCPSSPLRRETPPVDAMALAWIRAHPISAIAELVSFYRLSTEESDTSNARLLELWRAIGGAFDPRKNRAWIETHLLPGALRYIVEQMIALRAETEKASAETSATSLTSHEHGGS